MYRNVMNEFAAWHKSKKRKILFVKGAYGVGKTWAVKDFATAFFKRQWYVDLSVNTAFRNTISGKSDHDDEDYMIVSREEMEDTSIASRIADMEFMLEQHFDESDFSDSIIIFDEVQNISECDEFFHAFFRKHPDYTICLIASSMQITEYEYQHFNDFEIVRMRPMSFEEYLIANKEHDLMDAIQNSKSQALSESENATVCSLLKEYMLVGGMPKIVDAFLKDHDYSVIRPLQNELLALYDKTLKNTFSAAVSQRCRRIWKSVPTQLARNNKKFMYRFVEENARAREYAEATQQLCNLGIVRKLPRLSQGKIPLEDYVDYKSFELFLLDHGLLRAAYGLSVDETLTLEQIFGACNGAIAEQFLFQELSNQVGYLYYWVSGATARVPFVYEGEQSPVPIDIRFVPNKKAQNIKTFRAKNPDVEISLKISLDQVSLTGDILNIPAYGLWNM